MDEDTEPQEEVVEQVVEEPQAQVDPVEVEDTDVIPEPEEKSVPLHVLQKERKKRQEEEAKRTRYEIENEFLKEQARKQAAPAQDDPSQYEAPTKGEMDQRLSTNKEQILREVEERIWAKTHPERYQRVIDDLDEFLKQRPNLASAISGSTNRYEEAFTLMEALTPKQQMQLKQQPQKKAAAVGSPGTVPKGASMNQAVDVMSMTDDEYTKWRQAQKRRR